MKKQVVNKVFKMVNYKSVTSAFLEKYLLLMTEIKYFAERCLCVLLYVRPQSSVK